MAIQLNHTIVPARDPRASALYATVRQRRDDHRRARVELAASPEGKPFSLMFRA